jgi:hypothetical protein
MTYATRDAALLTTIDATGVDLAQHVPTTTVLTFFCRSK